MKSLNYLQKSKYGYSCPFTRNGKKAWLIPLLLILLSISAGFGFNLESNTTIINNVCTGVQNKMMTTVYPCHAQDLDGKDIIQYINFTWTGGQEVQTNWGFVYNQPLEEFIIYNWNNITGWVNITGKMDYSGNNLLDEGKDYYVFKDITLKPGEVIQTKWVFTPKDNARNGKWHQFGWEHGTTIKNAINSGQYYYLDPWWNVAWGRKRKLTIDKNDVDATLTNFPVLVSITDARIEFDNIKALGADVRFLNSAEDTELPYEIEYWSDTENTSEIWVKIPSISSSVDTDFYVYYNNTGASDNQNATGVWDVNYSLVYHFNVTAEDSTSNNRDGIVNGGMIPVNSTSIIENYYDFDGTDDNIAVPASLLTPAHIILQCEYWHDYVDGENDDRIFYAVDGSNILTVRVATGQEVCTTFLNATGKLETCGGTAALEYYVSIWDSTNDVVAHSVNGAAPTNISNGLNLSTIAADSISIGRKVGGADWYSDHLDEVRCSNARRSDAWIKASYESGRDDLITFSAEEGVPPEVGITSPTNITYYTSNLTLTYHVNSTWPSADEPYNCSWTTNNLNLTMHQVNNNTDKTVLFYESSPDAYNISLNCYDGLTNNTASVIATVGDINLTMSQNATAYEGITNFYNVSIGVNPDIIHEVNASLYWNGTYIGFYEIANTSPTNRWANMTLRIPIISANNTSINTYWNTTMQYTNSSIFYKDGSNTAQACQHAWVWDATTFSALIETEPNDLSINITKLFGVSDPPYTVINVSWIYDTAINPNRVYLTNTYNTSTKLGYSNDTRTSIIPAGYTHSYGFNVTLNFSLNHPILGYNSRVDTNSTYNYSQVIHGTRIINCSIGGLPTLNLSLWEEVDRDKPLTGFVKLDINLTRNDGSIINQSFDLESSHNYTLCVYPSWLNLKGDSSIVSGNVTADYWERRYYHQNTTFDNTTLNTKLFLLNKTIDNDALITFIVQYYDGTKVSDAIIQLERHYVGEGANHIVAMASRTDTDGKGITWIEYLTADYAITVKKNGVTLAHFIGRAFTTEDTTFPLIIGDIIGLPEIIEGSPIISMVWTNSTSILNLTVSDSDSDLEKTYLYVWRTGLFNNTLVCNRTIEGISGSTYCDLSAYREGEDLFIYRVNVVENGIERTVYSDNIDLRTLADYGQDAIFAIFLLTGSLAFIGLFKGPGIAILLGVSGLAFSTLIFQPTNFFAVLPIIVLGVILLVFMERRK